MSVDAFFSFRCEKVGVVILTLAWEDFPFVKALRGRLEVPFSKERSFVACFLKEFGKGLLIAIEVIPVVHEAIVMAMLSGEDDGAARAADRVCAEAILEKHALRGELIDIWRRVDAFEPAIVGADCVRGVIV